MQISSRFEDKKEGKKIAFFGTVPILLIHSLDYCMYLPDGSPVPSEVLENSIFMTNVVLASIHRNNSVVKFYDNVKVETIECETAFSGRRSISFPIQSMFPFLLGLS